MVALRCKHCGAPLERKDLESGSAYVTCPSCGTTQQKVDAKAYMDQMMGQIQSWISKAIPGGFSLSQTENVDSIARFNIFNSNIRPRIETEYTEYRFAANSLLACGLMVLPFTTDKTVAPAHSPSKAFEFNARAKSVYPLAVDAESRDFVTSAEEMGSAYALLINNAKLLHEDKPGRYALMANNFSEMSKSFSKIKGYGPMAERFSALAKVSEGCDRLLNGNAAESRQYFADGLSELEAVKAKVSSDLGLGMMFGAVSGEASQARILADLSDFVAKNGGDPMKTLDTIHRIMSFEYPSAGGWGFLLGNKDRFNEVFENLSAVLAAKNGGALPIASGAGQYLIPFWDIDLRYSFQTGSLFSKKSVEVVEDLLVQADFVIDRECLSDPASALTDIFSIKPVKSILAGVTGKETSISGGEGIGRLSSTAAMNSPGSRRIAVPLSTKREAEKVVNDYLQARASSDGKLKLSKPYVKSLIYVPCDVDGAVRAPEGFGALVPKRTRRTGAQQLIVI
ncbi:MAG: hypothetical protein LBG62_01045 [Candidatus Methanoplasma sp.]|jgi:hypothetical protein|nr:hypothetical protein [Candidatus Methanoplasma sp.]